MQARLVKYLGESSGARLDSLYMDSLATANKIEVVSGAPTSMRQASDAPEEHRNSTETLVRYSGGQLTVKDYLRWVRALPPQYTSQLKSSDDTTLTRFAKILTQNVLLIRDAEQNKITISPVEWASLKQRYAIVLVEHDMDAVFRLADRISVLVYGRVIATDSPQNIRSNEEVRRAYLGEDA